MPEIPWANVGQQAQNQQGPQWDEARKNLASQPPVVDTNALEEARLRQEESQRQLENFNQAHPFKAAGNAFMDQMVTPVRNEISRLAAHVNTNLTTPDFSTADVRDVTAQRNYAQAQQEIAQHRQQAAANFPYDPEAGLNKVTGTLGAIAPIVAAAPFGMAPAAMLNTGFEHRAEDIDARRAGGQDISPAREALYQAGGGLLDYGMGSVAPGGRISNAVTKAVAPAIANPLGRAAVNTALTAGLTGTEMELYQGGQNLNKMATGIENPQEQARPLLERVGEGIPEAYVQGLGLGGGGRALHELTAGRATPVAPRPAEAPAPAPTAAPEARTEPYDLSRRQAQPAEDEIQTLQRKLALSRAKESGRMPEAKSPEEAKADADTTAALSDESRHQFTTPKDYTGFQAGLEANRVRNAAAANEYTPERRVRNPDEGTINPDDERRVQQVMKGATFQTPEEAGASLVSPTNAERAGLENQIPRDRSSTVGDILRGNKATKNLSPETLATPVHFTAETPGDAEFVGGYGDHGENGPVVEANYIRVHPNDPDSTIIQRVGHEAAHQERDVRGMRQGDDDYVQPEDDYDAYASQPMERSAERLGDFAERNWRGQKYDPQFFQGKAGEQAVREEYGEPVAPKAQAVPASEKTVPPSPEGETVFQKAARLAKSVASEESGGMTTEAAGKAFLQQDVIPAVKKAVSGVSDVFQAINRSENLGIRTPETAKTEARNITRALADAKINGRRIAAQIEPAIPHAIKFADDWAGALKQADQWEHTHTDSNPVVQKALDHLAAVKNDNAARGEKLGLSLEETNSLKRMAFSRQMVDPNAKAGKGGGTVQGDTSTLIKQKYDTFSEAMEAGKRKGLVPEDPDPLTGQIRAQYEMSRLLGLREQLHASEDGQSVAWIPEKTPAPDGHVKITDRIANQTRKQANPDWVVGKYGAGDVKEGGFAKQDWLDKNAGSMIHIRPGDALPDGFKYNGRETRGQYHAPDETANKWNTSASNKNTSAGPLGDVLHKIARASVAMRYDFSPVHAINGVIQHIAMTMGQLVKNVPGVGHVLFAGAGRESRVPALDLLRDLNIFGLRSSEVVNEIQTPDSQAPDIQQIARRIQRGGTDLTAKSVLDKPLWDGAVEKFKTGNWQGGTISLIDGARRWGKQQTFGNVLNRIAAIQGRQEVESQMQRGISEDEGAQSLSSKAQVINDALGRHVDTPRFKNSLLEAAARIVAPAASYRLGLAKNVGRALYNEHARTLLVGTAMTYMVGSAATQMALTLMNTGKIVPPDQMRDYWNPRTGRKDASGHDERLAAGTGAFLARLFGLGGTKGVHDELRGTLNPLITHGIETYENKDYAGNQVRPKGGSFLGNTARGTGHTLSGALPMAATSQVSSPQNEEQGAGTRIAKYLGTSLSHPVTSSAEQTIYDAMPDTHEGRTPDQQAKYESEQKWVAQIRSGDKAGAIADMMKDPTMSFADRQNVRKRAEAKQGLEGLVLHPNVGVGTLQEAWDAGSDEDHQRMKDGILHRVRTAQPKTPADRQKWQDLKKAVQ